VIVLNHSEIYAYRPVQECQLTLAISTHPRDTQIFAEEEREKGERRQTREREREFSFDFAHQPYNASIFNKTVQFPCYSNGLHSS